MENHIDFIEGDPLFNETLVPGKKHGHKLFVKLYQPSVLPSAVLPDQMHRTVKMGDRHKRLNSVFLTFPEYVLVKGKARLVRLRFISLWENSGPSDAHTECLKSHFREHGDIFFIMMVEINSFQSRVIFIISCVWPIS